MSAYQERHFKVPGDEEEALSAELWRCGTLGIEVRDLPRPSDATADEKLLIAYFSDPLPADAPTFELAAWQPRGIEQLHAASFREEDWMAAYRARIEPLSLGRFIVHSGEPDEDPCDQPTPQGSYRLRIPARTAFGTGSHESTRLTLAWLDDLTVTGQQLLDVGTGSGILSFAGLLLGAKSVVAYDIESQSVCVARTNCQLNDEVLEQRSPAFFAGTVNALRRRPCFDLALINVLPERILDHYPDILARLRPGATVISSGNLVNQEQRLLKRFVDWGLTFVGRKVEGDWLALALRFTPRGGTGDHPLGRP